MKDRNFFTVSADLPLDAESYFVERDSTAFRSLLSSVRGGAGGPPPMQCVLGEACCVAAPHTRVPTMPHTLTPCHDDRC